MIKFRCENCNQKLSIQDQHSGKQVKCPKCSSVVVVPDNSDKIKFHCKSCSQNISVPKIYAGKKGKCPRCKNPIVVPSLDRKSTNDARTFSIVCLMCEENIQVPETSRGQTIKCPECGSDVETSSEGILTESEESQPSIPSGAEEDEYEETKERAGLDRRLLLVICGGVAVVVVGLIILVAVVLPSGSGSIEEPDASPRREAALEIDSQSTPVASDTQPTGTSTLQSPKEDIAPKEPVQSSATASDDIRNLDLKLRLKTGQNYNLQIISETNRSQTIKERQSDYSYINTTGLELKVEQVDIKGVAWLKVTYLTIHEITKSARGQVEYDSTMPDTAVSYPNDGPLFTAMIGQSFIAKVTPEGEIIELEDLAEMYQRMTELVVENEDEATRRRMAEASNKRVEERTKKSIDRLNQRYGSREKRIEATRERLEKRGRSAKKLIIEMLRNVIMPFPGRPVGIGDSWQARTALFSLGAGAVGLDECTYTLRENKQAAWLVDFSSKIELDDELLNPEAGSRATLIGSCKGSLEIDPSSGWLLHKNVTTHYSGEIRYPPTERTPQGLTRGLSMEIVITVKPIE
jgi:DNA-directed RNA polymerase subunit RPC12/RpoP